MDSSKRIDDIRQTSMQSMYIWAFVGRHCYFWIPMLWNIFFASPCRHPIDCLSHYKTSVDIVFECLFLTAGVQEKYRWNCWISVAYSLGFWYTSSNEGTFINFFTRLLLGTEFEHRGKKLLLNNIRKIILTEFTSTRFQYFMRVSIFFVFSINENLAYIDKRSRDHLSKIIVISNSI